jgi:hypothetical protein
MAIWEFGRLAKQKTKKVLALITADIMADILKWLTYDVYDTHWQICFEHFPYYSAFSHGIERCLYGRFHKSPPNGCGEIHPKLQCH